MGRKRKTPTRDHGIKNQDHVDDDKRRIDVEKRLGLHDDVCQDCNARNDSDRETCRKCGSSNLRGKKHQFHDA